MKRIISLLIVVVMMLSGLCVSVNAENVVTDELFDAIQKEITHMEIKKEDINLKYLYLIESDKYIVRYRIRGCTYTADEKHFHMGNDVLIVPSMPVPEIFINGELHKIDEAYENGIIDGSDIEILKTFEELDFRLNGDVNNDKSIDILDVTLIQLYLARRTWDLETRLADFDRDNQVSIMDATAIQLKIAQIE